MINPVDTYMKKNHPVRFLDADQNSKWRWDKNGMNYLGCAKPGLGMWKHPNLVTEDNEDGRHIYLPDPNLPWMSEDAEPCYTDANGGKWDLFDDDYYLPRLNVPETGPITIKDFANKAIQPWDKEGKRNLEWHKSDHHIVFMRNRETTEVCPLVFEYRNDAYCESSRYVSTVGMSFQEKLQIARDCLQWVRENHHEGDGEFEYKVDKALKDSQ